MIVPDYHVLYPSGNRLSLSGQLRVLPVAGDFVPTIDTGGGKPVFVLDPRGIVLTRGKATIIVAGQRYSTAAVAYDPRRHGFGMPEAMQDWLLAHPEWRVAVEQQPARVAAPMRRRGRA